MSFRERLEQEFKFQMAADPVGAALLEWRPGDPRRIEATAKQRAAAFEAYVIATKRTLLLLADLLDGEILLPGEQPEP